MTGSVGLSLVVWTGSGVLAMLGNFCLPRTLSCQFSFESHSDVINGCRRNSSCLFGKLVTNCYIFD